MCPPLEGDQPTWKIPCAPPLYGFSSYLYSPRRPYSPSRNNRYNPADCFTKSDFELVRRYSIGCRREPLPNSTAKGAAEARLISGMPDREHIKVRPLHYIERVTYPQVERPAARTDLALLPVCPPEAHAPHLPMGNRPRRRLQALRTCSQKDETVGRRRLRGAWRSRYGRAPR